MDQSIVVEQRNLANGLEKKLANMQVRTNFFLAETKVGLFLLKEISMCNFL